MTHYQKLEYQRRYNAEHKEQLKAYYLKNKKKINAYSKKYYKENKWKWEDFYIPRAIIKGAKSVDKIK